MWFWNLLGNIIGIPFVFMVGYVVIYCIFYIIGKCFSGLKDVVKYPRYYTKKIKNRIKKYRKEIAVCAVLYIVIGVIIGFIVS